MNSPQSVSRVIQILEVLCASAEPVSLAQLSRDLAAPKSSLAALLRGLVEEGFVVSTDSVYRLGPLAFGLGSALLEARRRVQSSALVRDGMRRLADRSDETVLWAVRDECADTITYVEVIESRNAIRFTVPVGDRRPLYCTSGGRALLAAGLESETKAYLQRVKPQSLTGSTEVDKAKLASEIEKVRESGIAQTVVRLLMALRAPLPQFVMRPERLLVHLWWPRLVHAYRRSVQSWPSSCVKRQMSSRLALAFEWRNVVRI